MISNLALLYNSDYFFLAMGKFMKTGKVVLVLNGRFAGRKAVIVKVSTSTRLQVSRN